MKIYIYFIIAAVSISIFPHTIYTQKSTSPASNSHFIAPSVKKHISQWLQHEPNAGMVLGVIKGRAVEYFSHGVLAKDNKPVDQNTIFEIGSITKIFTALLIMDNVVQGKMSLHDPIGKYLTTISMPDHNEQKITLNHLINHTSGLPVLPDNIEPMEDPANPYKGYTTEKLYSFLSNYQLPRAIGKTHEYSNLGYGLLGHIAELYLGKNYEQLIKLHIAEKLSLKSTTITLSEELKTRYAEGHAMGQKVPNWDGDALAGCMAIRSTAADLVRFVQANMGIYPSKLYPAMQRMQKLADAASPASIENGWQIANQPPQLIYWHNGGTGGYRSIIGFNSATQEGVVMLTNNAFTVGGLYPLLLHLFDQKKPLPELLTYVDFDDTQLAKYVGKYKIHAQHRNNNEIGKGNLYFDIQIVQGRLAVVENNEPQFLFYPLSQKYFFYEPFGYLIQFDINKASAITGLIFHQWGGQIKADKI